jgi:predicted amidophosphoribosyltransferase
VFFLLKKTALSHVCVSAVYKNIVKQLVQSLKFRRVQNASKIIARQLHRSDFSLPEICIIVSVPAATCRRRQRGYDQSELIAKHF